MGGLLRGERERERLRSRVLVPLLVSVLRIRARKSVMSVTSRCCVSNRGSVY